jgi:hypothetical protein
MTVRHGREVAAVKEHSQILSCVGVVSGAKPIIAVLPTAWIART